MTARRWRRLALTALLLAAGWQLGSASYLHAKAALAQVLLRGAWAATLERARTHSGAVAPVRPWPWADTWPVARLEVPAHAQDLVVLDGASGAALAFAPGHLHGSAPPGRFGTSIIAGHRDTHFAFLRALRPNTLVLLHTRDGRTRRYRVATTRIVDSRKESLTAPADQDALVLLTCYPFTALQAGGPLRYLVTARAEAAASEFATFATASGRD